jgi:hypothetical protein
MRRVNGLLFASLLGVAPAFAGQDATVHGSVETSAPESLSAHYDEEWMSLREEEELLAREEGSVIYIYPMEE